MYLFFLETGSIALAVAAAIFLILYVVEWKQRIKEEARFAEKLSGFVQDYEHRQVEVEKKVQSAHDFIEMLIQKSPLMSEEVKQAVIKELKENRPRVKMPHEFSEATTGQDD